MTEASEILSVYMQWMGISPGEICSNVIGKQCKNRSTILYVITFSGHNIQLLWTHF